MTIVGFSLAQPTPYFIVRNSWGPNWGLDGYVYIAMTDGDGVCGINMAVSYPNLIAEQSPTEFWMIFSTMAIAVFIVVPINFWLLRRSKA